MSYLVWASYPVARLNGDDASKPVLRDFKNWGRRAHNTRTSMILNQPKLSKVILNHLRQYTRTSIALDFTFGVARSNSIHIYRAVLLVLATVAALPSPERSVILIFDRPKCPHQLVEIAALHQLP